MKTLIHKIIVSDLLYRVGFQIRLPQTTKRIIALDISTNAYGFAAEHGVCGALCLSFGGSANSFYEAQIQAPKQTFNQDSFTPIIPIGFGAGKFWIDGTKQDFENLCVEPESLLIEGFYENVLPLVAESYEVTIYLKIEP